MTDRATQRPVAVRWLPTDPFAHLDDIHRRMNQLMHHLTTNPTTAAWTAPAVDIEETDEEFVIDIDLPGATERDVYLEWNHRALTVHGQLPSREHTGVLHQRARHPGPLHHTIDLPAPVLGDKVTATLTHGVLTIHAPKTVPGAAHRIHIIDPDAPNGRLP
ncbi:hypothetical protein GCM10009744_59010 [Kribbella alba]|uniref:SHSP domain-containing protein n=1 Tax=Kribbella alba TaxID=190197 RepID=A0ABN2FSV7_9ACTN